MAEFRYRARDKFSRLVTGTTSADTNDAAAKKLSDMGYVPIEIVLIREPATAELLLRLKRVSLEELNVFTRQLFALQKAGISIMASLESIMQQTRNAYFKGVLASISDDIRGGMSFSQSLNKYPAILTVSISA